MNKVIGYIHELAQVCRVRLNSEGSQNLQLGPTNCK